MEKKVRILMVLLCLFLFPLRVFALEEAVGTTNNNQSNDNVAVIEDTTENVVESTDNEELPVESSNEESNVASNIVTSSSEESTTPVVIDKIALENVNFDLKIGKLPEFSGRTLESDSSKYTLVYEAWNSEYDGNRSYYYSLDSKNEEWSQNGTLIDKIEDSTIYNYEFAIKTKKDTTFSYIPNDQGYNVVQLVVNGEERDCYVYLQQQLENGDEIYTIRPNIYRTGFYEDKEYLDSIRIDDVNYHITVGKKPIYSAKLAPSLEGKIRLSCESWSYYLSQEDQETDYYEYNFSDPRFAEDEAKVFETFEEGKAYDYELLFHVEDGYALKTYYDSYYPYHIVYVNGEKFSIPTYYILEINGTHYYFVDTKDEVEPATESYTVTEGANTTLNHTDEGTLQLRVDGEFDKFENVFVDNQLIHEGYTAESGSTILTFTNAFLKSLSVGTHEVVVTYSDGKSAYTTLTIQEGSTTKPVTTATSNRVSNTNSYTSVIVDSLADKEETDKEIAEDDKDDDEKEDKKKDDKNKSDKPEKESLTKTNSTFYIILVIIFLIIIAIPFVIDRKKQ